MESFVRIAETIRAIPGNKRPEVTLGVNLTATAFDQIRAALGNPPVKKTIYSYDMYVIESIDVEIGGVEWRALYTRPATAEEIAKLDRGDGLVHEHNTSYRCMEV